MADPVNNIMLRTLLLEDETLARWVARKSLEEAGAHVVDVETCADARAQIVCGEFDLFVFDFRLPDGTGRDVIEFLRERRNRAPVIVLSAETEEFPSAVCEQYAIRAVLTKPVNVEELEAAYRAVAVAHSVEGDAELPPPAGGEPETDRLTWIDRYLLHALPADITSDTLAEASESCAEGGGWLALDFSAGESLDEAAVPVLVSLAAQCRMQGGRLALLQVPEVMRSVFRAHGVEHEFDVVRSRSALEALSRRLSSDCERLALLDSIVLPSIESGGES
jgi:CheY-like chemotaxis protein/anti-anti-sigma regulatory factor